MEKQDELVGFWENGLGEGSGLHGIWGYGTEFLPDGEGFEIGWGSQPGDNYKFKFFWQRISDKTIKRKYDDNDNEDWDTIEYEIKDLTNVYGGHILTEKGKEEFLSSVEPLLRLAKRVTG